MICKNKPRNKWESEIIFDFWRKNSFNFRQNYKIGHIQFTRLDPINHVLNKCTVWLDEHDDVLKNIQIYFSIIRIVTAKINYSKKVKNNFTSLELLSIVNIYLSLNIFTTENETLTKDVFVMLSKGAEWIVAAN